MRKNFLTVSREMVEGVVVEISYTIALMLIALFICFVLAWIFWVK